MSTVTTPILTDSTFATKMDLLIDKFGKHTLTITATSNDGTAVTNQTIKIYNAQTMTLYSTLVYNAPTSLTINLPDGFSYYIVPECTLANHYCEDKPSGMITQNTTVTLTYKTLGTLSTFTGLKACLDAGLGGYITLGQEVSYTDSVLGEITYECVDWDEENGTMTLLSKYIINDKQFDASEALYQAQTGGLAAGDYSFIHGSSTYYFTLTQAIPEGGQLRATTSTFNTYSTKGGTTEIESGTVSTTAISGATSLGTTASGLLNHMDRVNYGSNDYGESALRQWLNASGSDWWQPKTMFDRPCSYTNVQGFMTGIPSEVLAVIDTTTVLCASQNTYCAPDSSHTKNSRYTLSDKFYLASQMEIFGSSDFTDNSKLFTDYVGRASSEIAKTKSGASSAGSWWLRSPYSNAYYERYVDSSGSVTTSLAYASLGVVAACKISKS